MAVDYRLDYQRYQRYYLNLKRFYQKPVAKVSIFVVISFMTVSFFSVFAIKPTLTTIGQLVKEIEDKGEINTKMDSKLADLARAQAEYGQIRNEVDLVWRAIPDRPEMARLILELELLALQQQVKIVNLQVEPVQLVGKLEGPASFSVTAGGGFEQAKQFAQAVSRLERVIVVEEANFAEGTPFLQKEGISVTVTVRGKAHFEPEGGKGAS